MCLDTVNKVTKPGKGYGYKKFTDCGNGVIESWIYGGIISTNVWLICPKPKRNSYGYPKNYTPYYHIFTSKKAAEDYDSGCGGGIVLKVLYEDVTASGKQDGREVIIARQMYVCKEEVK